MSILGANTNDHMKWRGPQNVRIKYMNSDLGPEVSHSLHEFSHLTHHHSYRTSKMTWMWNPVVQWGKDISTHDRGGGDILGLAFLSVSPQTQVLCSSRVFITIHRYDFLHCQPRVAQAHSTVALPSGASIVLCTTALLFPRQQGSHVSHFYSSHQASSCLP